MSTPNPQPPAEPSAPNSANSRTRPPSKTRPGLFKRTPRDFVDMFVERWWIGAIAGAIAVAGIIIFRPHFEPLYRTEATLMFETKRNTIVEMRPVTDTILQN